ncbi:GNAT family N-acetyltransferase [Actinophytocola sp. NPDC049390]|uniref:GNAT family N-acetyltransferase n=1 Tax=Actinophytocola sp. NPDC049390 TaxID=3363894 RepID=UPI00378ADFCE
MIRPLRQDDGAALARMLARCSPETRYQRFHGVATAFPPAYLRRCLTGEHTALVAEEGAEVVALASVGPVFGEPDVHEVAAIVEDRWQSKGLGRELVATLLARAGVAVVRMEVCRTSLLGYLTSTLPVRAARHHGCDTVLDLDVRSAVEQWRQLGDDRGERGDVAVQPG